MSSQQRRFIQRSVVLAAFFLTAPGSGVIHAQPGREAPAKSRRKTVYGCCQGLTAVSAAAAAAAAAAVVTDRGLTLHRRPPLRRLIMWPNAKGRVSLPSPEGPFHPGAELSAPRPEEDSAVLSELKDTIRLQALEIAMLKQKMQEQQGKQVVATTPLHGGAQAPAPAAPHHGGGESLTAEELAQYLTRPFYRLATRRVGWLSLFLLSLSLTALIMNGFEHTLESQIELAYFVPLLAGHGGNTGGQTVGTVLSAMSAGEITLKDAPRVIGKEALAGVMVGLMLGATVGPVAHYVMGISMHVSMVVAGTLPLVSAMAATLGSAIPFACVAMGLDPSVIAAPAMTSLVDVGGLVSYFLMAEYIFEWFGISLTAAS